MYVIGGPLGLAMFRVSQRYLGAANTESRQSHGYLMAKHAEQRQTQGSWSRNDYDLVNTEHTIIEHFF